MVIIPSQCLSLQCFTDFSNNKVCKKPFIGVVDEYQSASGTQEYVRIMYRGRTAERHGQIL
jgi:hypothetical protein